jgi:Na+/H+-translocating membrane pyrophosphatase
MKGTELPDYAACVRIVTWAALDEMIAPGLLAVVTPVVVGFSFKILGSYTGDPLLGATVLEAMMISVTITGILMGLMLNNAGGAWDNAKKYIETGAYGGKNSEAFKAAVTGDTVGSVEVVVVVVDFAPHQQQQSHS